MDALRIELAPNPVVIGKIEVVANRFDSRRKAAPVSIRAFTTEQMQLSGASDVYDFIDDRINLMSCPPPNILFNRVENEAVTGASGSCVRVRGRWVAPRVFVDDVRWFGDIESLRGWSKADIHRVEVVQRGVQIWIYTRAFADRLAKGQVQLSPYILVR